VSLIDVPVASRPLGSFDDLLVPAAVRRLHAAAAAAGEAFAGRAIFNINSTARGGGVAELLQSVLPLARGAGVDARWMVVPGDEAFFRLTKRLHNRLHGAAGDGGPLNAAERDHYEATLAPAAGRLLDLLHPGDLVVLHDPQTVGLAPALHAAGHPVVWRAHIGVDSAGELTRTAWAFLAPYVAAADVCVFSRRAFAWDVVPAERRVIVSPTIDPFSPKNRELTADEVAAVLRRPGIALTRPYVMQCSRWDALKDPAGVLDFFARHVAPHAPVDLVLAGPAVGSVGDDPEGATVLNHVQDQRLRLPDELRERVHLLGLPMDDPDDNALMVNALQRGAAVVVQKSLAEGFGLTVTEAMWKARPVVASARGGLRDQIHDRRTGLLLHDPRDGAAFGAAVLTLLDDEPLAERLGNAARERVRRKFLSDSSLVAYLRVLAPLAARTPLSGRRSPRAAAR
jgi:trehalose synthase